MKTKLIIIIGIIYSNFFTAQIPDEPMAPTEYPNFYTQTVNKMNNIIPNKTIYYGQPLSTFLQNLNQNNLSIKDYEPGPFNNKLLTFRFVWNREIMEYRFQNDYVEPVIKIYFQQPFNYQQTSTMMSTNGYHSYWNPQAENFFKDLIIEKIEFCYVNGLTDKTSPPK